MWNLLETSFNGNVKVDRLNSIYVGDAAGRVRTKVNFCEKNKKVD